MLAEFNEFDHSKVDLLSALFRQRVESQIYRLDATRMKEKVFEIMRSCHHILIQKTHITLIRQLRQELGGLFEFDEINVFYKDQFSKSLVLTRGRR